MKKIFKLTALLLIAGAMMMTGCKTEPDETDKLPGTWTTSATYLDLGTSNLVSKTGSQIVYTKSSYTVEDDPGDADSFNYYYWYVTEDTTFTGFIADAKSTPDSTVYGFTFCMQYNSTTKLGSYYTLFIDDDSFKVVEVIDGGKNKGGTTTNVIDWKKCESLNLPKEGNKVTVFTDDSDGSIIIRFNNDENAGIIRNPVLKKGMCGVIGTVSYPEYQSNTPIQSTYEFKKFQY